MKYFLLTNTAQEVGYSGESLGSNYDLHEACKKCGAGAKLVGELKVKLKDLDGAFVETLNGDFLISEEAKNELEKNIKIDTLLQVSNKHKTKKVYYHLISNYTFPKLSPDSKGIITDYDRCFYCRRSGYFDTSTHGRDYVYTNVSDELLQKSDIFNTWECFGLSNIKAEGNKVVRYARPRLIISEKVMNILMSLNIKNALFEKINIVS